MIVETKPLIFRGGTKTNGILVQTTGTITWPGSCPNVNAVVLLITDTMKKRTFILLAVLLPLFACTQAAGSRAKPLHRPNIVWIVCEDMSPHLSCYGETAIETPHLDGLAKDGVRYTNVYTVAGVCAPSRSGIITGLYPSSIGTDNMRNYQPRKKDSDEDGGTTPSYSAVLPDYAKCFPENLRAAGYYCTNNAKEDYQFEAPVTVWDESSNRAHWRNRPAGVPFFAVFNLNVTHESKVWERRGQPLLVDPANVTVPPYYPDVPEVRQDLARHLSNVIEMDRQAGAIIKQLKDDGLYDSTIVFFYSDHGDGLPYVKREVLKRGLQVPLIVKMPGAHQAGTTDSRLVSGVDFGPTVLSLAGVQVPAYMHGQPFLGAQTPATGRRYVFAARDRMDEEVDRVRTVFDGRNQYIKNYQPGQSPYQDIDYRHRQPMMRKMLQMRDSGLLNAVQMRWFREDKPVEELYDTEKDPYEFHNLATDPAYAAKLKTLRGQFDRLEKEIGDQHAVPEPEMVRRMWGGGSEPPATAAPQIREKGNGVVLSCATKGASIGYKVVKKGGKAPAAWQVYGGGVIPLGAGDRIVVQAQRIGYKAAQASFTLEAQ